jgi:hypothetical protein
MTLGSHLRLLHTCLDSIDAELTTLYDETFAEPNNDKGIARLQQINTLLVQLDSQAFLARLRIATLLEIRRGTQAS